MNRLIILVTALALANGDFTGQAANNIDVSWKNQMSHEYPSQVVNHPELQHPGYEYGSVGMGPHQLPVAPLVHRYQVPFAPKTFSNWMGICDSVCKNQMVNHITNSVHDMIEERQHKNIGQLLEHLEQALQKVDPEVSLEEIESNVHQLADQILHQMDYTQSAHLQHVFQEYQNIVGKTSMGGFGAHVDVKNLAEQEALRELRNVFIHEHEGRKNFTAYIQHLLEDTIIAHVAVQTTHKKKATEQSDVFHTYISDVFHFQVKELIQKTNILRTEVLLDEFNMELKQIDALHHFQHQQLHLLEIDEIMQKQHPEDYEGNQQIFEVVHKKLQAHQRHLLIRKLALQMIVRSFEKVLLSQQGTMEQMTVERIQNQDGGKENIMSFMNVIHKADKPTA